MTLAPGDGVRARDVAGQVGPVVPAAVDEGVPRLPVRRDRRQPYDAVLVYRADLPTRVPAFAKVLERLRKSIDAPAMQSMNARADLDGVPFAKVAGDWVAGRSTTRSAASGAGSERTPILQGTLDRSRPILMTSATTVLGLLPLVLFTPDADARIWKTLSCSPAK